MHSVLPMANTPQVVPRNASSAPRVSQSELHRRAKKARTAYPNGPLPNTPLTKRLFANSTRDNTVEMDVYVEKLARIINQNQVVSTELLSQHGGASDAGVNQAADMYFSQLDSRSSPIEGSGPATRASIDPIVPEGPLPLPSRLQPYHFDSGPTGSSNSLSARSWTLCVDQRGLTYYHCPGTGQVSKDLPSEAVLSPCLVKSPHPLAAEEAFAQLYSSQNPGRNQGVFWFRVRIIQTRISPTGSGAVESYQVEFPGGNKRFRWVEPSDLVKSFSQLSKNGDHVFLEEVPYQMLLRLGDKIAVRTVPGEAWQNVTVIKIHNFSPLTYGVHSNGSSFRADFEIQPMCRESTLEIQLGWINSAPPAAPASQVSLSDAPSPGARECGVIPNVPILLPKLYPGGDVFRNFRELKRLFDQKVFRFAGSNTLSPLFENLFKSSPAPFEIHLGPGAATLVQGAERYKLLQGNIVGFQESRYGLWRFNLTIYTDKKDNEVFHRWPRWLIPLLDPSLSEKLEEIERKDKSFIKDVEDRNGDPCLRMQLLAHRQPKSGLQTKLDPKLNVTLHDYQEDSVRWLCDVEMGNTPPNNHFWLQFKATRGGVALWYSPSFYRLRIGNPSNVRGGLLSEEMGLGKTIEVMALMNLNPRFPEESPRHSPFATPASSASSTSSSSSSSFPSFPSSPAPGGPSCGDTKRRKTNSLLYLPDADDGKGGPGGQAVLTAKDLAIAGVSASEARPARYPQKAVHVPSSATTADVSRKRHRQAPVKGSLPLPMVSDFDTFQSSTNSLTSFNVIPGDPPSSATILNGKFVTGATLIIVPLSVISQWRQELLRKNKKAPNILIFHGAKRNKDPLGVAKYDVVLTTYATAAADGKGPRVLGQINWHRIVLDEGHVLKNPDTEACRAIAALESNNRWVVTGTPVSKHLGELRGQLKFLGLDGNNRSMWRDLEYCGFGKTMSMCGQRTFFKYSNFIRVVFDELMMGHRQDQPYGKRSRLLTLPSKHRNTIFVRLSQPEREVYDQLLEAAKKKFKDFEDKGLAVPLTMQIMRGLLLPLRQVCSGGRIGVSLALERIKRTGSSALSRRAKAGLASPYRAADKGERKVAGEKAYDEESDNCPICLDIREEPLQTSCGHTFCAECINSIIHGIKSRRACPMCRVPLEEKDLFLPYIPREGPLAIDMEGNKDTGVKCGDGLESETELVFESKTKALVQQLQEMLRKDPKAKALVFSQFTETIRCLIPELRKRGIGVQTISGNMPWTQRRRNIEAFQNNPLASVFVLSIRTGAVGLTLTAASHVFMLEPCTNPALEAQAINRVLRIGQTKEVTITHILVEDSVEERIAACHKVASGTTGSGTAQSSSSSSVAGPSTLGDGAGNIQKDQYSFRLDQLKSLFF